MKISLRYLNGFGVIVDFGQNDSVPMATLCPPNVQSGHRVAIGTVTKNHSGTFAVLW